MSSMSSVKNSNYVKDIEYIQKPAVYSLQYTDNLESNFR